MYRIPRYHVELVREKSYTAPVKIINRPRDVYTLLQPAVVSLSIEKFCTVLLDTKYNVIGISVVSSGILNAAVVHPREVFQRALMSNSAAIILVHNHPSGDVTPSQEDIDLTKKLVKCGKIMQIDVLDHIILSCENYKSLKEANLLD
ncbi:MAG: JAB domain-containing protein [Veillonellales bacterium]